MSNSSAISSRNAVSSARLVAIRAHEARVMLAHAVLVSTAILAVTAVVLVSIP